MTISREKINALVDEVLRVNNVEERMNYSYLTVREMARQAVKDATLRYVVEQGRIGGSWLVMDTKTAPKIRTTWGSEKAAVADASYLNSLEQKHYG